jgi:hypothetical protein
VFAAGKTNAAEFMVNEITTLKEAAGREEESEREKEGGTRRSMARTWWHGCKLFC